MRSFSALLFLLMATACGPAVVSRSAEVSSYAARASWQWESAEHFLLRGRARLEGENQVFSGPFLLWASKNIPAVRADFCGPDGSPLISLLLDSEGCLIYQPEEARALFFTGGMPAGSGYLDVYAVISLIRTGFPVVPVQWEMVASCDTSSQEENRWFFISSSGSSSDTALVSLKHSQLFPLFDSGDFSLEPTASSWHDEFNAWPMEWRFGSSSVNAIIRVRSYDVQTEPHGSVWGLVAPVPVDTVSSDRGSWDYAFDLPIR
ncbi:MAG: hypothetical protein KAR40_09340 [Candidatus Sabulitectum sp.]|nr:hypothetical protein [Candidatus Sabulitectum sp.]